MCGILGSVGAQFGPSVLDTMRHRGPDDEGLELLEVGKHVVCFGHRRLSIQDLSPSGHQPMYSPCGRFLLIFNGEIYNHLELRKRLSGDTQFIGHSDTETVLLYLAEFGIDALEDLNGIFALALLDTERMTLHLVRDPVGVKPVYYTHEGGAFYFASEQRPLREMLGPGSLDRGALASVLRLRFNPAPDTLLRGVKKLPPGYRATVSLSGPVPEVTLHPYARSSIRRPALAKSVDLVQQYGEELRNAVRRQLLSDVEVGILLSGGLDSAVIAALAQAEAAVPLKAFTIGFVGAHEEDEIADAAETAALLGLDHHVRRIGLSDFLHTLETCVRIVEEPLATTSVVPMYFLSEMAASHVKVVLSGQGADEPLGGY